MTAEIPSECDYLVVGGGATGMAFVDTLLLHHKGPGKVVLIDNHEAPGGQWLDSYGFVKLHQVSSMYGVESSPLEPKGGEKDHRAERFEVVQYYERVRQSLQETHDFIFVGGVSFDLSQLDDLSRGKNFKIQSVADHKEFFIQVNGKVVDARYLQPDLPVTIPPKFRLNPDVVKCITPNEIPNITRNDDTKFVVIGSGKTGMDSIYYLLNTLQVHADRIQWIMPNDAWITARENVSSCMEFLHTCTELAKSETDKEYVHSADFFQNGFLQWEKEGRVYRYDADVKPTKFKDATLCQDEISSLRRVKNVIRHGRVEEISDTGTIQMQDGTLVPTDVSRTIFIHCSAGAFHYTKQFGQNMTRPVFAENCITIQDVYGTPGFCFVGSLIARLECLTGMSNADKNQACRVPAPPTGSVSQLGPSGGDVGKISADHGLVQRLCNLRDWLSIPEVAEWLHSHRLFNLRDWSIPEISSMVKETYAVLEANGLIPTP